MKKDVTEYVSKCLTCQQVKAEHQVPTDLLNSLPTPQWKWDNIIMDFVSGFPLTQQKHDSVWVIVDKLTKSAHFIRVMMDYSMDRLAELYVKELYDCMVYHCLLCRIEIRILHRGSRRNYSQPWVLG